MIELDAEERSILQYLQDARSNTGLHSRVRWELGFGGGLRARSQREDREDVPPLLKCDPASVRRLIDHNLVEEITIGPGMSDLLLTDQGLAEVRGPYTGRQ